MQICDVKFLDLAFRLGVVFAIFGFLWGILNFFLRLLRAGRPKTIVEEYLLKFLQYFFLVNVTFLFCVQKNNASILMPQELILAGLILILYFTGKLQNNQNRLMLFQMSGANLPQFQSLFNLRGEIIVITLSMTYFVALIFFPEYAANPISNWFYESILDIETTPVFGFIFKVIGFFVLLGILSKLANGLAFLITGAPLITVNRQYKRTEKDENKEDRFDDFEELN